MEQMITLSTLSEEEFLDEIHIYVVPEMIRNGKTKGWTSSVKMEISWKGNIIAKSTYSNIQEAVMKLPAIFHDLCSAQLDDAIPNITEVLTGKCFQVGCANQATTLYQVLGDSDDPNDDDERIRYFCAEHADRGNIFEDDCNEAYEVLEDEGDAKVVPLKRVLPKPEKLCPVPEDEVIKEPTKEETEPTP
jgi:hypothetical protein